MIINNDYINQKKDYLKEEREGLDRAIKNLDRRYQNKEIDRDTFFKDLNEFKKRGDDLNKRMGKR